MKIKAVKSKQRRAKFVRLYVANGCRNATAAYTEVYGCSYDSARSQAARLFRICPLTVSLFILLRKAQRDRLDEWDRLELQQYEKTLGVPLVA